jgi:hypothetical protein
MNGNGTSSNGTGLNGGLQARHGHHGGGGARFQTEIEFTLPKGYLDATGILHRHGVMRLATAADEILPQRDPRVQQNPAYFAIIVLARVLTRLGDVQHIDTKVVEGLFACDLDYLQRLYERINGTDDVEQLASGGDGAPGIAPPAAPSREATVLSGGFRAVGEG